MPAIGRTRDPIRGPRADHAPSDGPIRIRSLSLRTRAPLVAERQGDRIDVMGDGLRVAFGIMTIPGGSERLQAFAPMEPLKAGDGNAVFAAFELLFGTLPGLASMELVGPNWADGLPELLARGLLVRDAGGRLRVFAEMVWQIRSGWMAGGDEPFPVASKVTGHCRHPCRPPLVQGRRYARFIPWLGGVVSFDTATLDDLDGFHRWMNDPRIDRFWHEAGDIERHRRYLEAQSADPHTWPLIARFDGEAFGYFEIYWAKESLIGPLYDAGDHDRGWHVLIGEDAFRGRPWVSVWLPALMHLIFLDDPRTVRIVGEPAADHPTQLRNLARSGFERIATIDLPAKRAALVSLSRRRFFEDRLWHPAENARSLEA